LEVSTDASDEEIRSAYRRLAQQWHPDQHPENPEEADYRFKEINLAYEVLSDSQNRRLYDLTLEADLNDVELYGDIDGGVEVIEDAAIGLDPVTDSPTPPPIPIASSSPEKTDKEEDPFEDLEPKDEVWSPYETPKVSDRVTRKVWSGCSYCGSIPAREVNLVQDGAWLVWRSRQHLKASLCRDCGIAEFRRMTNLTLIKGWWGPLPFLSNIQAIFQNVGERARLRKLVPPAHPMQSDRKLLPPLNPGLSVFFRPGMVLSLLVVFFLGYVGVSGALPGFSEVRQTGAAGLIQSAGHARQTVRVLAEHEDVQMVNVDDWYVSGDPGVGLKGSGANKVTSMSVFQTYSPDAIGDEGKTPRKEEDVQATPSNRLSVHDHGILVFSASSLHDLADIEVALGLRHAQFETGLPNRKNLYNWQELKLDPRKPFHAISWLKDGQRSVSLLYPMLARSAVNQLLSKGKELPGESAVVILNTHLGNIYLQDFGSHIAFSNSPVPLAEGNKLLGPLSQRFTDGGQVLSNYRVNRSGADQQASVLEELGAFRKLLESAGYPSHGVAVLGWTVVGSHMVLGDEMSQMDETRFHIGQNGDSLQGALMAQVLKKAALYGKLSTMRTQSPIPIIGVSPRSYFVVGLDRTLAKDEDIQDKVLTKLEQWITELVGPLVEMRTGLNSLWQNVEDVVLSLSYSDKSGHNLMTSTWVNDEPFDESGRLFLDRLKAGAAKRVPHFVAGSPQIRGIGWLDMMRELREATRFGLVRADPLDDNPLFALGLKVSGSPTSRAEGPGFKAFIEAFNGRMRFAVGRYNELFIMGMGQDALSQGWLAVKAKDLEHRAVRELLSIAPANPQIILWSDFDLLTDAIARLQKPLCGMPYAGTSCVDIKEFGLKGRFAIVAGHEEGALKLQFDLPYNSIQVMSGLKRLWNSQILPKQAAFAAMASNMLGGPRKYAVAPSNRLRRGSRLDTEGNRVACKQLRTRVCAMCGEDSDACKRYRTSKRRHCGTELIAMDKLIGFGRSTRICGANSP
jgi:hypothetical protein